MTADRSAIGRAIRTKSGLARALARGGNTVRWSSGLRAGRSDDRHTAMGLRAIRCSYDPQVTSSSRCRVGRVDIDGPGTDRVELFAYRWAPGLRWYVEVAFSEFRHEVVPEVRPTFVKELGSRAQRFGGGAVLEPPPAELGQDGDRDCPEFS